MKNRITDIILTLIAVAAPTVVLGQSEVVSPCPEVLIDQKYDHVTNPRYRQQGWDTAITCTQHMIELTSEPYIPVQYFNGTYTVEQVPYNPPDPTFSEGTRMPIGIDDVFASSHTNIPYSFYFFGIKKSSFRIGANGIVTFCSSTNFGLGDRCPYAYRATGSNMNNLLPWDGSTGHESPEGETYFNRMHDAIYGVYEDTDPAYFVGSATNPVDGIFYGIQDTFPCRKIICSWKEAPDFNSHDNKGTYQIVCYEGSNIIEVHVKRRGCCPTTSDALIGIQNATGNPQQPSTTVGASNYFVVSGSPAAFWPTGRNGFTSTIDTTAYRFTPQGETLKSYKWYRLVEGGDSIVLSNMPGDTNGYYVPMDVDPDHPTLTRAFVSPKVPTRYVLQLQFANADGYWYDLRDTIFVGVDTVNTLHLTARGGGHNSDTNRVFDICQGNNTVCPLSYTEIQTPEQVDWTIYRILNGQHIPLPESMYTFEGEHDTALTLLPDPEFDTLPENKIDSVFIMAQVDFVSGCTNYDTILIRTFPNFETTEYHGICDGEEFTWHVDGNKYTKSTKEPKVNLHSAPGCDSIVHLDLTVSAVSHTVDKRDDCKPINWLNGKTYSESNTATMNSDTIVLTNRFGCDSVVQLNFTYHPLKAQIKSSLEKFDYDHLVAELNDVSIGNNSRRWTFNTGVDQTASQILYSIPFGYDEADINLIAYSQYGCIDTANIVIPFNQETFWVPNAFTPDNPSGNGYFGSVSSSTVQQEMYIYNRNGGLVFHCEGVDCQWDGNDLNGNPCPQGAYAYIIRYTNKFEPHTTKMKKGSVTLIR